MFQFRRFPSYAYFVQRRMTGYCPAGLPHSDIPGSMDICSSPRLFAACHVLLRLLMPRHSPYALLSLISFFDMISSYPGSLLLELLCITFFSYFSLLAKLFYLTLFGKTFFLCLSLLFCTCSCTFSLFGFQWSLRSQRFSPDLFIRFYITFPVFPAKTM